MLKPNTDVSAIHTCVPENIPLICLTISSILTRRRTAERSRNSPRVHRAWLFLEYLFKMSVAVLALAAMVMAEGAHAANYFTKHDLFTSAASPQSILSQVHVMKAPSGLNTLNSFLTGADTGNDAMLNGTACTGRPFYATCYDTPSIGSGFTLHSIGSDGTIHVTGVTDRGPNQDCGDISADWNLGVGNRRYTYPTGYLGPTDTSGKGFPVAKFAPTIVKGKLDKTNLKFEIEASCPLKRTTAPAGFTTYVTGLPTRSADDTPYDGWCRTPLAYDEGGLDMEDIQPIPTAETASTPWSSSSTSRTRSTPRFSAPSFIRSITGAHGRATPASVTWTPPRCPPLCGSAPITASPVTSK